MNQQANSKENTTQRQKNPSPGLSRLAQGHIGIGLLLALALIAFELFNFDTTQYALANLLGETRFAGLRWATILAIAFCAIDFAGLSRFFIPNKDNGTPGEVWYLIGAWLLAATMNALMTWWAVSLTLLNHEIGNEVLGRGQLIEIVPIFVAVLLWLTRILFIGSLSAAGERIFSSKTTGKGQRKQPMVMPRQNQPLRAHPAGGAHPASATQPRRRKPDTEGVFATIDDQNRRSGQPVIVTQIDETVREPVARPMRQTSPIRPVAASRHDRAELRMQGRSRS